MPFTKGQIGYWKNKTHTDDYKKRMSISTSGEKNGNFGNPSSWHPSKETTEKNRVAHLNVVFSKEHKDAIGRANKGKISIWKGKTLSEDHKRKIKESHIASPNHKFKDTSIELKIQKLLDDIGVFYIKQQPLCKIAIVDFYIPQKNLVIQCDGCYYHRCPLHHPEDRENRREKDKRQTAVLEQSGYKVIRFWEHEINSMKTISI